MGHFPYFSVRYSHVSVLANQISAEAIYLYCIVILKESLKNQEIVCIAFPHHSDQQVPDGDTSSQVGWPCPV